MGKNDFAKFPVFLKSVVVVLLLLGVMASPLRVVSKAQAADLPLATTSPLVGVPFDDRPLALPVQRNFQMAMLTASSELGRSCGRMEAYGWRMSQSEQSRVNQIFNTTVDHLRGMGYGVEPQAPTSVSHDITMFTADRDNRHFIFMWSAGELGLVMVLCESSQPLHYHNATSSTPSVQVFPQSQSQDVLQSTLDTPPRGSAHRASIANFSPVGDWVGGYTCDQGYTGGTLQISHLKGENFDGIFRFYPTPKNPTVPAGRYTVYGQYDRASQRILINPGKWLERPRNFYNTIMVGNFDPISRTFSAYFQGINGCTSFEAKSATEDYEDLPSKTKKHVVKKHKKKVVKKKPAVEAKPVDSSSTAAPESAPTSGASDAVTPASTAPIPVPQAPLIPAPAAPATPDMGPSSIVLPAPTPPTATAPTPSAPANAPPVSITPPTVAPPPAPSAPATAPAVQAPKPSGALEPRHSPKLIQLAASGQWFTPTSPQAPSANYITPSAQQAPQAVQAPIYAPTAPQAQTFQPTPSIAPQAQIAPRAVMYDVDPPQAPTASTFQPTPQIAPEAMRIVPTVQQAPPAQMVPNYRPANPGLQGGPDGG
jgi:hypothetical protein